MDLYFSTSVREKLESRGISCVEVEEAFFLHSQADGGYLVDTRAHHKTIPPTLWFIGETTSGRLLKIVFIFDASARTGVVKTAFEPDLSEIRLYDDNI